MLIWITRHKTNLFLPYLHSGWKNVGKVDTSSFYLLVSLAGWQVSLLPRQNYNNTGAIKPLSYREDLWAYLKAERVEGGGHSQKEKRIVELIKPFTAMCQRCSCYGATDEWGRRGEGHQEGEREAPTASYLSWRLCPGKCSGQPELSVA